MSVRIKPSKLKEYMDKSVSLESRVKKLDNEIKETKLAAIEAISENPMLARSLRKNLASLLQLREMIQVIDAIDKELNKNN